jgi:predicted TIM-barrel fold metal-dependent hydrolase
MVLEWVGPDRVIYGSDAPPLTSLKKSAIELIENLPISREHRDKILYRNARELLRLN